MSTTNEGGPNPKKKHLEEFLCLCFSLVGLFSKTVQPMMQHFLWIARGRKMILMLTQVALSIKCNLQPVFCVQKKNGRVTEWRSCQVFPICRPNDFDVKNPPSFPFLHSFLPSFLSSFPTSFVLHSLLPSLLSGFIFLMQIYFFLMQS